MLQEATREVLQRFEVRKSAKQKEAFFAWLCKTLREAGYEPNVERKKGLVLSRNIVVGDVDKAKVIFSAHYDTCAVLPFPNFITPRNMLWYGLYQLLVFAVMLALAIAVEVAVLLAFDPPLPLAMATAYAVLGFCVWWMLAGKANRHTANDNSSGVMTLLEILLALPREQRGHVAVVFFDNEEKGLFGSVAFAKRHKAARNNALLVNFDCVSDGDSIQFFPNKALKREEKMLTLLEAAFLPQGEKSVEVVRGFGFYPSDQKNVVRGVGVCALKRSRVFGYYMDRIHTHRDTKLDEANLALLRDGALRLAALSAASPSMGEKENA